MILYSNFQKIIVLLFISLFSVYSVNAQFNSNSLTTKELYNKIAFMDSLLFTIGFNECNFEVWNSIINEDLEFYDDRTGLNISREKEVASFNDRCGTNNVSRVKRKLVSMEVYPLNHYGAVQTGTHIFRSGKEDEEILEIAKFIHVWQKLNGKWKVTRVVSYNHRSAMVHKE